MIKEIEITFPEGKKVNAQTEKFLIKTDQLVSHGGNDSAPSPFQFFLSSLGTCAGYFALEFCQSRNISTQGLALKMKCHFDLELKRYTQINYELKLPASFPEKYKNSILRTIDFCTVKKHLNQPPEFKTDIILL